ncbi:2-dehydropantoate 2-reductase [Endozoicomonas arenosclerae]|uniref:2-dehydropantoate 2-reductase n=1 Tax=Endozoicomonas arenosclerae TaxID=1633495 RepID=UPI000782BEFD|nr:2-dehydropantoate 2-reductase [Endozoicomonas arenosclerae]
MDTSKREGITILGAGCIGCYLAGQFMAESIPVRMLGRARFANELSQHGLTTVQPDGRRHSFSSDVIDFHTEPEALTGSQLILLSVKYSGLEEAAKQIQQYAPEATVISLLNGLSSTELLKRYLRPEQIIGGSVVYGVTYLEQGIFKKTSEGTLHLEAHDALKPWLPALDQALGKSRLHDDIMAAQWSKLLLNLNNSINAMSGVPLKEQLKQRHYRKLWAECMNEGLAVMKKSGVQPVNIGTAIALENMPFVLKLPDFLFKVVAAKALKIDDRARMSMWADLQRGRETEVEELNGEVLKYAHKLGIKAITNQKVYDEIKRLEKKAQ